MSTDLAAAKAIAATKTQKKLDVALGDTSNNFDEKLLEFVDKAGMTKNQKVQFLRQLDEQLTGFMTAILTGQQPMTPHQPAVALGVASATPSAATTAPDRALMDERDDLRKVVNGYNASVSDLVNHFGGITLNTDKTPKADFGQQIIAASNKMVADAETAATAAATSATPADTITITEVNSLGAAIESDLRLMKPKYGERDTYNGAVSLAHAMATTTDGVIPR